MILNKTNITIVLLLFGISMVGQNEFSISNENGSTITRFIEEPIDRIDPNETLHYTLTIDRTISNLKVGGKEFDINTGNFKLQVHEIDETDVTQTNDTPNQVLVSESNSKSFSSVVTDFTRTFNLFMRAPSVTTNELETGRKYRVRLYNTALARVEATIDPFELIVGDETTLSTIDFEINNETTIVYPNPTQNQLFITTEYTEAILYDMIGNVVASFNNDEIFLEDLPIGTYILVVTTATGNTNYQVVKN